MATAGKKELIDPAIFRRALSQFPTGVTVVTAQHNGKFVGMTANSFASVSLSPPLVLWSVATSSPSHDAFVASDAFAIHFLAVDHSDLAHHFSHRHADKFASIKHTPGVTGAPLLDGLAPILECRTWARYPGGDHTILVGEVVRLIPRSHDPLLFHFGRLGRIPKPPRETPPLPQGFARSYLPYLLAQASAIVSAEFHATLKQWDLTVPEWRVLACLMDIEGLTVGQLARMALMKQPGMTKVLDRMAEDHLIKRKGAAEDRRRVTIHLTAKGRTRAMPVLDAAKAHEAELLARFDASEQATIKYALDLLINRGAVSETGDQD